MCVAWCTCAASAQIQLNAGVQYLQCMQKDMSTDFYDLSNTYFFADSVASFNVAKGEGLVNWKRYRMSPRQAFNLNGYWPVRMKMLDFPDAAYDNDPNLRLNIEFISHRYYPWTDAETYEIQNILYNIYDIYYILYDYIVYNILLFINIIY